MADILLDDITNTDGTGIFDRLMAAVNTHIDLQYQNNRITGSDYANVYLGSIQSVLQASVQYNLQEQLTEAQIDGIAAENLLKAKQLEIAEQEIALKKAQADKEYALMLATIDKELGFGYTLDVDDNLVRSSLADDAGGRIDYENINLQKQGLLLDSQKETAYTQRVLADKQASKLGLDNTMKLSEAERISNANYVYTPRYEEV